MQINLTVAGDGERAILSERELKPDLIIQDVNIPKLPGDKLLQQYHPEKAPVVVFSAYWNDVDLDRAFALGVRGYVRSQWIFKPLNKRSATWSRNGPSPQPVPSRRP